MSLKAHQTKSTRGGVFLTYEVIIWQNSVYCWNKINGNKEDERKYIILKELDLCEECGEFKPVIIMERRVYHIHKFRYVLLPIGIVCYTLYLLWRLLILPYLILKDKTSKFKDE